MRWYDLEIIEQTSILNAFREKFEKVSIMVKWFEGTSPDVMNRNSNQVDFTESFVLIINESVTIIPYTAIIKIQFWNE